MSSIKTSSYYFPVLSAKFPLLFRGMSTCGRRGNTECPWGNKGANTYLNAVCLRCVFEPLLRRQGRASFVVVMVLFIGLRSLIAPSCSTFVRHLLNVFTHKAKQNQNHTLRGYRLRRSVNDVLVLLGCDVA